MPSSKSNTIALRVDDAMSERIAKQAAAHEITASALLQHILQNASDALWKMAALRAKEAKNSPKDLRVLQNQRRQMASRLRALDEQIATLKKGA